MAKSKGLYGAFSTGKDKTNSDNLAFWKHANPKRPKLTEIMIESCDWKQHLPWKVLSRHATQIGGVADEIDVWTGDERIGIAAPQGVFDWVEKQKKCGMELFIDSASLDDENCQVAWIEKWYWAPKEKRLWVGIGYITPNKTRTGLTQHSDLLPFEEWELLMEHFYPPDEDEGLIQFGPIGLLNK